MSHLAHFRSSNRFGQCVVRVAPRIPSIKKAFVSMHYPAKDEQFLAITNRLQIILMAVSEMLILGYDV
jgi:hypothetical protein